MGSPPVQTPVSFLNGGAAAMFSAECVKLLNDAGYNQNHFGSYDHVNGKIAQAKAKCEAWDSATAKQRKKLDPPTLEDRYLAGKFDPKNPGNPFPDACQSGHLTQNAVYQPDAARGNPCLNAPGAPGHDMNQFPCMPQKGHAHAAGGEHAQVTDDERRDAGRRGNPGDPYPASNINRDSNARAKALADDAALAQQNGRRPLGKGAREAAAKEAAASGAAAQADAAKPGTPSRPKALYNKPLTGKTAGDCINSFRKAAEQAMQDRCADEREDNRSIANGGPRNPGESKKAYEQRGAQNRAQLAKDAAAARKKADNNPTKANKQAAASAERASSRAERAKCRADQGDRIASGDRGSGDGEVPANAY